MRLLKQSSTAQPLVFLLVASSDHIAGLTGATPTVTLSKNGGAFASPSGTVTEIANGWYKVAGNATDTATLGPLILHATAASADPVDVEFEVVAVDPQSANAFITGINSIAPPTGWNLPTYTGTPTIGGTGTLTITGAVATQAGTLPITTTQMLLSSGAGAGQLDFTAGVVKSNLAQILGTALTETAGLIAAGFKKFFNVATPTGTVNSLPAAIPGAAGGIGDTVRWSGATVPTPNVPGVPIIDFEYFLGTLCSGGMLGSLGPAGASGGLALATENTVASGNATAGSNNTITLQSTSGVYPGARLHLISATGTGQSRIITAVNGLIVTVGRNWDVNPASGTAYRVVQDDAPSGGGSLTLTDLNTGLGTLQTHGDANWEGADPATVAAAVAAAILIDASKKIHTTDTGVIVDGGTVDNVTDPVTVDTGDGTIPIDENTIALDGTNLLVTEFGEPVPGVRISVWLKSEYTANPVSPNIAPKGRTVSNDDGTWRSKIFLDPGSYIVTARVPSSGTEIPKEIEVGV